jgi:predicted amidohydrolase
VLDPLAVVAEAARNVGIVAIVGIERPTPAGLEIVAVVLDADGSTLGVQPKTQIDPTEEPNYVPGSGRQVFTAACLTFGIATCHEGFRYPEISCSLAVLGAQVVFAPHYVTTDDGSLPHRWCDPSNPFHEKALLCRAMENTIYVGAANVATPDQGSITGIIAPDGRLLAGLPYGQVGVVAADIEVDEATRRLALRWAPERNLQPAATPAQM